jgi:hypothetical protein
MEIPAYVESQESDAESEKEDVLSPGGGITNDSIDSAGGLPGISLS